jgi:L-lysine 2,3-aminomutase
VLPFKVSGHAVDHLIDWSKVPDDPIYRLLFPHRNMLLPEDFLLVESSCYDSKLLKIVVAGIRGRLNPHPGGQLEMNVPEEQDGLQHKYVETVLIFPKQGQTCHSYCSYCFRWAQFIGDTDLKIAVDSPESMVSYLKKYPMVSDVLLTGGDPLVMKTEKLAAYIRALLVPELSHIRTIRVGTKALSFHPARVAHGADADELLRLSEEVVQSGKHLAYMLHFSHPREMEPEMTRIAIRRLQSTGAQLRSQAPVVQHVNDSSEVWSRMWCDQVNSGIHPYYMFVERDTGAHHYFGLPLVRAHEIYTHAIRKVSGLARTARGPVMSATPGKVVVDGVANLPHGKALALRFLQARNADLVGKPFFAKYNANAQWWDELSPLANADQIFFNKG